MTNLNDDPQSLRDTPELDPERTLDECLAAMVNISGDEAKSLVAAWPWPRADSQAPLSAPPGWDCVRTEDFVRIALTANVLHFSRPTLGYLWLGDETSVWRVDLTDYTSLLQVVLRHCDDRKRLAFGFVANDVAAGILGSQRQVGDDVIFELCCWGL